MLVHGSVIERPVDVERPAAARRALRARRPRTGPASRPGRRSSGSTSRSDAEWVAEQLRPGDHLCGHSYGGVISLLAARVAAGAPLADGDRAARDLGRARQSRRPTPSPPARSSSGATARREPEAFLRTFLRAVGSSFDPPSPLPPELEQGARTLMVERGPWEAEIPLAELRAAPFPKLVVSGAHHAGVRRDLRRARARARRRARRPPGRRPHRPARAGLQRDAGRVPRARDD